jgi:hypothetical protein
MSFLLKDPLATVDYAVDWRADYLDETDNLAGSQWAVEPSEPGGAVVISDRYTLSEAQVTVGGGIAGHRYRLVNTIRTASGREDTRSIVVRVEAR